MFNSADFVAYNRVIFNISGNKFRLICRVSYGYQRVLVRFVGTYKEYDAINLESVMNIRPLITKPDYDWALAEAEQYFDNEPARGTQEADRFNVLSALIENYEAKYWLIEAPDPIEALSFQMEHAGTPKPIWLASLALSPAPLKSWPGSAG